MGSPACVRNTGVRFKRLGEVGFGFFNELFQLGNFSDFFESTDFVLLVAVDCKTCRIISPVFKPRET